MIEERLAKTLKDITHPSVIEAQKKVQQIGGEMFTQAVEHVNKNVEDLNERISLITSSQFSYYLSMIGYAIPEMHEIDTRLKALPGEIEGDVEEGLCIQLNKLFQEYKMKLTIVRMG